MACCWKKAEKEKEMAVIKLKDMTTPAPTAQQLDGQWWVVAEDGVTKLLGPLGTQALAQSLLKQQARIKQAKKDAGV